MKKYTEKILLALKIGIPIILALVVIFLLPRIVLIVALAVLIVFCISSVRFVPPDKSWVINRLNVPRTELAYKLAETSIVNQMTKKETDKDKSLPSSFKQLFSRMVIIIPFVDKRVKVVDLSEQNVDLPPTECISNDGITFPVDTVIYFQNVDPIVSTFINKLLTKRVINRAYSTLQAVIGEMDFESIYKSINPINVKLKEYIYIFDEITSKGVQVNAFEVTNVFVPEEIKEKYRRKLDIQLEADNRVTEADGRLRAAQKDAEAERVQIEVEREHFAVYENLSWTPALEAEYKLRQIGALANGKSSKIIATGGGNNNLDFFTKAEVLANSFHQEATSSVATSSAEATTADVKPLAVEPSVSDEG